MAKKAPRPPVRRRSPKRRRRARYWALMLAVTIGATSLALVVMFVFLVNNVNRFDGDEIKELTALASILSPILLGMLKLWEVVINKGYFS
jgi:uncharacterized BrkB/YihY/UPF0761 family membrane protein